MHPDVRRLVRLVAPPEHPVAVDLDAFEREVGAPLPADFNEMMQTYGPGGFDDFLTVLPPDPSKRHNVFARTAVERWINEGLAEDDPAFHFPYPIYPDESGLLKWGEHDEHRLWWLIQGDPDRWPVLIQGSESEDFFAYHGTATGLVCDVIQRTLDVWFIPEEAPWSEHRFDPLAHPDAL